MTLEELITRLDQDLPAAAPLEKIGEAQLRSHTLSALGDQLIDHYVSMARQEGASWTEIGDAIGVSKQAAQQKHSPQIFERFTNRARHAIVLAQESARSHKHDYIGTEHVLLGLLAELGGLAHEVLVAQAGSEEAVRTAVEEQMRPGGKKAPRGHIPFTRKSKEALEQTLRVAKDMSHFVGTEHVLLGLLAVPDGTAATALSAIGIDQATTKPLVEAGISRRLAEPKENTD